MKTQNESNINSLEKTVTGEGMGIGTIPWIYAGNIKQDAKVLACYAGLLGATALASYIGLEIIGDKMISGNHPSAQIIQNYPTIHEYVINNARNCLGFAIGAPLGIIAINSVPGILAGFLMLGIDSVLYTSKKVVNSMNHIKNFVRKVKK